MPSEDELAPSFPGDWRALDVLTGHYKLDSAGVKHLKEKKIYKAKHLKEFCKLTNTKLYRVNKCQALSVAILVANNIPVMFEMVKSSHDTEHIYALFYKYARRKNPNKLARGRYSDPEKVYLAYNIFNDVNTTLHPSKAIVDGQESALTSDLFDAAGKSRFSEKLRTSREAGTYANSDVTVYVVKAKHLVYDKLYLLLPNDIKIKQIKKMLEVGLGDRDFSYTVPKFKKVFK